MPETLKRELTRSVPVCPGGGRRNICSRQLLRRDLVPYGFTVLHEKLPERDRMIMAVRGGARLPWLARGYATAKPSCPLVAPAPTACQNPSCPAGSAPIRDTRPRLSSAAGPRTC